MLDDSAKNYEVGYKRPPREHQFKPGQSGNPKGRPKINKNFVDDITDELNEVIIIKEAGKTMKITKQRGFVKRLVNDALNGKVAATKIIISTLGSIPIKQEDLNEELSVDDAKILEEYIKRRRNHD